MPLDDLQEDLFKPTQPVLQAKVHEYQGFCAQKLVSVILQLPAVVPDSFLDARIVSDKRGEEESHALLVHMSLSGLVWKVALPFPVDLEASGAPTIAKLRRRRMTLTIQGLKALKPKQKPGWSRPLVVRSLSGKVVHSLNAADDGLAVMEIVSKICENTDARSDEVKLMLGTKTLLHDKSLGQCIVATEQKQTLELSLAVVQGPPLTAFATSGARIEVLPSVPLPRGDCHFDRDYVFTSLGDFDGKPGMRYVMTCNDDRKTSDKQVMWQLDLRVPATVYLNFRSQGHVQSTGALTWLARDGWEHQPEFKSSVSSGYPNGPYSGPVYAKSIHPKNRKHVVNLMGSNCWEGTYFVFVELDTVDS